VEEIHRYLDQGKEKDGEVPFVTSQKSTKGFTANSLAIQIKLLYRAAGITGGSSHSGRRSFLTNLAAKGVQVRVLQELAGHRSLQTTQRYIEVNDHLKRKAVELIG
jgi:integrase/recombinase XerD